MDICITLHLRASFPAAILTYTELGGLPMGGAGIPFTRNTRHQWYLAQRYYYLRGRGRGGMRNCCCSGSTQRTKDGRGRWGASHPQGTGGREQRKLTDKRGGTDGAV